MISRRPGVAEPADVGLGIRQPLADSPVGRLRPRTAPQILDAGFEVMRFRAKAITILLVVLHGPFYIASVILLRQGPEIHWPTLLFSGLWRSDLVQDASRVDQLWVVGSTVCAMFGEMLFAVGLATMMRGWLEGADLSAAAVLRATLRRFPAILAVWLIALVLKAIGAALCLVGLLVVVPQLSILAPVMAFESGQAFGWIARSRQLVNRMTTPALFLTLMAPVLSALISWALRAGDGLGISHFEEFSTIMSIAVSMLLLVARCSAMTLFYLDIRVRTEGLDLAIRAPEALGGTR